MRRRQRPQLLNFSPPELAPLARRELQELIGDEYVLPHDLEDGRPAQLDFKEDLFRT